VIPAALLDHRFYSPNQRGFRVFSVPGEDIEKLIGNCFLDAARFNGLQ